MAEVYYDDPSSLCTSSFRLITSWQPQSSVVSLIVRPAHNTAYSLPSSVTQFCKRSIRSLSPLGSFLFQSRRFFLHTLIQLPKSALKGCPLLDYQQNASCPSILFFFIHDFSYFTVQSPLLIGVCATPLHSSSSISCSPPLCCLYFYYVTITLRSRSACYI